MKGLWAFFLSFNKLPKNLSESRMHLPHFPCFLVHNLDFFLGFKASTKLSGVVALNDVVDTLYRVKKITD